ncbi:MAG: hypothetical protein ACREQQ_06200, partial [Candidatus Binatia bacterium]
EALGDYLDRTEHCLFGVLAAPELLSSLTVIAGGGIARAAITRGRDRVARFLELAVKEYLDRCVAIGFRDRAQRSKLRSTLAAVAA